MEVITTEILFLFSFCYINKVSILAPVCLNPRNKVPGIGIYTGKLWASTAVSPADHTYKGRGDKPNQFIFRIIHNA